MAGWSRSSAACAVGILPAKADLVKYTIVELPTLGGSENFAYAINDSGDVVGLSRTRGDLSSDAFLFRSGVMASLAPLEGSNPQDINTSRQIASGVQRNGVYLPAIFDSRTGRITMLGSSRRRRFRLVQRSCPLPQ